VRNSTSEKPPPTLAGKLAHHLAAHEKREFVAGGRPAAGGQNWQWRSGSCYVRGDQAGRASKTFAQPFIVLPAKALSNSASTLLGPPLLAVRPREARPPQR